MRRSAKRSCLSSSQLTLQVGDTSSTATPAPPPPPKLPPCSFCRKMEPKGSMARCKTCTFSAHSGEQLFRPMIENRSPAGCYGIASQDMGPEWECELCANLRNEEAHLVSSSPSFGWFTVLTKQQPHCVLCPQDVSALSIKAKKRPPSDFDVLSCLKPTEGRQWAHILCACWHQEVQFTTTSTYKAIENITSISKDAWEAVSLCAVRTGSQVLICPQSCSLCGQQDGAVVGCSDCALLFHASCAWTVGHRFGFEFSLVSRSCPTLSLTRLTSTGQTWSTGGGDHRQIQGGDGSDDAWYLVQGTQPRRPGDLRHERRRSRAERGEFQSQVARGQGSVLMSFRRRPHCRSTLLLTRLFRRTNRLRFFAKRLDSTVISFNLCTSTILDRAILAESTFRLAGIRFRRPSAMARPVHRVRWTSINLHHQTSRSSWRMARRKLTAVGSTSVINAGSKLSTLDVSSHRCHTA